MSRGFKLRQVPKERGYRIDILATIGVLMLISSLLVAVFTTGWVYIAYFLIASLCIIGSQVLALTRAIRETIRIRRERKDA